MGDKGGTVIYLEYESFRIKYRNLQEKYDDALTEKEKLLTKAMPSATRYDKEPVKCNSNGNPNEDYVISLEEKKIDEKIEKFERLLSEREKLINIKEKELRKSNDIYDRIYLMRIIDGLGFDKISQRIDRSRAQTYRMYEQIKKRCSKVK